MYTLSGTSIVTPRYRGGGIPRLPPAVGATDGIPESIINTHNLFFRKKFQKKYVVFKNNVVVQILVQNKKDLQFIFCKSLIIMSGKRDSNPRPSAWEADALPLSYSRKFKA
jgi:hypothetical protein